MSVETNIAARKRSREVVDLIGSEEDYFWSCLVEFANSKLPQVTMSEPVKQTMSEARAIKFEAVIMPYGKYKGSEIGCIPASYFINITEKDKFAKQLEAYLESARFKKRLKDES